MHRIKDAVSWASIPEQALHYQFNARNQIVRLFVTISPLFVHVR